ncbi:MAG: tyrosine-type recombinase/integrase [Planctomycetota bacterium]
MPKSTERRRPELGRHAKGLWYKKYRGRFYYFYRCDDDPEGAFSIEKWRHDKLFIDEGQEPPVYDPLNESCTGRTTLTVKDLCNHWLSGKETLHAAGELQKSTFDEYKATCDLLLDTVGKTLPAKFCGPQRFEQVRRALAKKFNANGQAKRITQIRSVFTTSYEDRVLEDPPNFGRTFRKPKAAEFRKLRNAKGDQTFTPEEFHAIYKHANINLRGMMLLGLQSGFGNEECAALPRSAIEGGWITWARVKSAVPRRVPLWPETEQALKECIEHATAKGEESLVFFSERGKNYITERKNGSRVTGVFRATQKRACKEEEIESSRTFYDLRRTFETIGGEAIDQAAVDTIMGHTPSESNMAARYRQNISEDRLKAVVNHVREWLGPIGGES